MKGKKVLFLFPYPSGTAGSQRFRFEQYFHYLEEAGFSIKKQSFLDEKTWKILYKKGYTFQKVIGILKGFLKRLFILFSVPSYDYVFIHREATPVGPPIFEWIIAKIFRKKIIFDFDDAIWLPNTSDTNKFIAGFKFHDKTAAICKMAHKVSAGNEYIAEFASKFNENTVVNPTTIDTVNMHNQLKKQDEIPVKIGWTGTHTTLHFLEKTIPTLLKVYQKKPFTLIVIANTEPSFDFPSMEYKVWNKKSEIEDLLSFHIGLMPLTDDPWARGKCGFKALQYMALGIPAIASPIGVNKKIIDDKENGYLCANENEWEAALLHLLNDNRLRVEMGINARKKIERAYSVEANSASFLSFFE
ncbi:MAG: glycosyltransferase family 1 protein [Chitinophagaceae bacterium]|nr:MAG: glycosyltransferase family 1 protein [Chitinophagaceae bacterium]